MENWLELDLNKLEKNFKYIKMKTNSSICSVIKADSYGLGSESIALKLDQLETNTFAVAFLDEALELRKLGIKKDIIIFNYIPQERLEEAKNNNLIVTLYSLEQLKEYIKSSIEFLSTIKFHIKLNTGMNRLGFDIWQLKDLVEIIKEKKLRVEGLYSHFAHAEDMTFTNKQNELFISMSNFIEKEMKRSFVKHIANSTATLKYENFTYDMVRVGMVLYGLQPIEGYVDNNIECIFTWKSKITHVRKVKKGERISYGQYRVEKDMCIGTIPVGYSHGYMRQLSNKGEVYISGEKYPIVGKICMDQMLVDISKMNKSRKLGVEVELLGENITPEYLAYLSGTIADDIICKISPTIKRIIKR